VLDPPKRRKKRAPEQPATKKPASWLSWDDGWSRKSNTPTPLTLKVVIIIQGILFAGTSGAHGPASLQFMLSVGFLACELGGLFALWRLRRWSVHLLVVAVVVYAFTHVGGLSGAGGPGILLGVALRSIALAAVAAYWRILD
jgi:hypothetical protein